MFSLERKDLHCLGCWRFLTGLKFYQRCFTTIGDCVIHIAAIGVSPAFPGQLLGDERIHLSHVLLAHSDPLLPP